MERYTSTMSTCEMFACRRSANVLYDQKRFTDAALKIGRATHEELRLHLSEAPVDAYIDNIPQSLLLLDTLYSKFYLFDEHNFPASLLKPDRLLRQLVWFLAREMDPGNKRRTDLKLVGARLKNLLRVIHSTCPGLRDRMKVEKCEIDRTVAELGLHGLVNFGDRKLIEVVEAVRHELADHYHRVKGLCQQLEKTLHKLPKDDCATTYEINGMHGPVPSKSSHQRLMNLHLSQLKGRLQRNEYVLQVLQAALRNSDLQSLERILQKRIRYDRDILGQFAFLTRRNSAFSLALDDPVVAHVLVLFSRGYEKLLHLMPPEESSPGDDSGLGDEDDCHTMSPQQMVSSNSNSNCSSSTESPEGCPRDGVNLPSEDFYAIKTNGVLEIYNQNGALIGERAMGNIVSEINLPTRQLFNGHFQVETLFSAGQKNVYEAPNSQKIANLVTVDRCCNGDNKAVCGTKPKASSRPTSPVTPHGIAACAMRSPSLYSSLPSLNVQKTFFARPAYPGVFSLHGGSINLNDGFETGENVHLKSEVERLQCALNAAQAQLKKQQEETRLATGPIELVPNANCLNEYGLLYTRDRTATMQELDQLTELRGAEDLQSKILLSVVVLSFRFVRQDIHKAKEDVWYAMREARPISEVEKDTNDNSPPLEFLHSLCTYLLHRAKHENYARTVTQVSEQIWDTLYDFASLKLCKNFHAFMRNSVRLAWHLSAARPQYVIEFEGTEFDPSRHARHPTSDAKSPGILQFVWPALVESKTKKCIYNAVVFT